MPKNNFFSLKRIFALPKPKTENICASGLLIALTVVLSAISGYLRIGNIGKLSLSFASVFAASAAFGGLCGGFVAVVADIISYLVNPVGVFLPYLTGIEFIYGFTYGFFFYKVNEKGYLLRVFLCDIFQLAFNVFIKTAVLSQAFGTPYRALLPVRIPMAALQFAIVFAILTLLKHFSKNFLSENM